MTKTDSRKGNSNTYIAVAVIVVLAIVGVWYYMTYLTPKTVAYTASLTGANEVPPSTSTATGQCSFTLSSDGRTLHFLLRVNNLTNITASHIHLGAVGANGPVVVPLYTGPAKVGPFTGTLAEGDITASTLVGSLQGRTIGELVEDINNGQCYVNVHTTTYPGGEIRGIILLN